MNWKGYESKHLRSALSGYLKIRVTKSVNILLLLKVKFRTQCLLPDVT